MKYLRTVVVKRVENLRTTWNGVLWRAGFRSARGEGCNGPRFWVDFLEVPKVITSVIRHTSALAGGWKATSHFTYCYYKYFFVEVRPCYLFMLLHSKWVYSTKGPWVYATYREYWMRHLKSHLCKYRLEELKQPIIISPGLCYVRTLH